MKKKLSFTLLGSLLLLSIPALVFSLPAKTFKGKPTFTKGKVRGAAVWEDNNGIHLRVTTKGKTQHFHGKVCTPKKITRLDPVKLENEDSVSIGPRGHCIIFSLHNHGGIDGFDFKAKGKTIEFDIKQESHQLNKKHIWVGKTGVHPNNNPFVLSR